MKKGGDLFDVNGGLWRCWSMWTFGTFLLEKIRGIWNKVNIGLYRHDGLAVLRNKTGTHLEKIKKKLQRLFKKCDLQIIAESNLKIFNYLDVTLNLKDGTFRPYHKLGDQIQYIQIESNHPSIIIKHISLYRNSPTKPILHWNNIQRINNTLRK